MAEIDVRGDIVPNDDKWIYDWLEWEATSPQDVRAALSGLKQGETLTVSINSGGGDVMAGQEIYSLLHGRQDVEINIQSLAGSAASVIAMANRSEISPVAMIMIHNVSISGASGDFRHMQKYAEMLQQMNAALASSYVAKTGMAEEEILELMNRETWITANQALEMGFVDAVSQGGLPAMVGGVAGMRLTDEVRKRVLAEKAKKEQAEAEKEQLLNDLDLYGV